MVDNHILRDVERVLLLAGIFEVRIAQTSAGRDLPAFAKSLRIRNAGGQAGCGKVQTGIDRVVQIVGVQGQGRLPILALMNTDEIKIRLRDTG